MFQAGFEPAIPASERTQTRALARAANGIGWILYSWVSSRKTHKKYARVLNANLRVLRSTLNETFPYLSNRSTVDDNQLIVNVEISQTGGGGICNRSCSVVSRSDRQQLSGALEKNFETPPLTPPCLSVCLFVRLSVRIEQLGSKWTDFRRILYSRIFFCKSVYKIPV